MTTNALPISRLIAVNVNLNPAGAQSQSLSSLLLMGTSAVIDIVTRMREYFSLTDVAADFGTSAEEYLAAVLWFEQAPQPTSLLIGRWAKTAAAGQLICAPLTAAEQALSVWTAIVSGGFSVTIDGGSAQHLAGLNFSGATNMNAIATIINVALTGAVCAWNSVYQRFQFTSNTTGAASAVSFLSAPSSGSDISDNLLGRSTDSGAYVADGIAAETALACVTLFDNRFGQRWYATVIPAAVDADHLAVAAYVEGTNTKHIYGVTTAEAAVLNSGDTTNIAYLLKALGYKRTVTQYSSTNLYAVASLLGRILTTNYTGNNTVITLMYKQEPGIVAETLTGTQIVALESYNCNVFVEYNNNTAIVEQGKMASGDFVDEILGIDWLALTIQTALFNLLYTSPTKIPQTNAGTHLLITTAANVCSVGVQNGLLAPGVWNSQGFGELEQGQFLSAGFYIYAIPLAQQSQSDREARKSVPIQIAAKLAGAVHTVDVQLNVNR